MSLSFIVHHLGRAAPRRRRPDYPSAGRPPQSRGGVDPNQMLHPLDHAAHLRRIPEDARTANLVEPEPFQGGALIGLAADRAGDLRHLEGSLRHLLRLGRYGRFERRPRLVPRRHGNLLCRLLCCLLCCLLRRLLRFLLRRLLGGASRRIGLGFRYLLARLRRGIGRRLLGLLSLIGRRLRRLLGRLLLFRHGRLLPRLGGAFATAENLAHLAPAALRHAARARRARQRLEGRLDHVVRVGGPDRFGHHVVHAQRLEDGAHRAAGDDARARRRRAHDDLARAVAADDVVMERAALAQGHADHGAPRLLRRLADRLGHLARLAGAIADTALAVADDDDRREAEAPAALHHLGDAIDADELFDEIAVLAIAALAVAVAPAPAAVAPARGPSARRRPFAAARSCAAAARSCAAAARSSTAAWCACHERPFP